MKHWLGIIVAMFALPAWSQANLVTNGSFESGVFAPPTNDTQSLPVGSTTMTGWTVLTDLVAWIGPANPFGLTAPNGGMFLDLTEYQNGSPFSGVQQFIATVPGSQYTLSFALGTTQAAGLPASVTATVGATSQVFSSSAPGSNVWTVMTLPFTASSASTLIRLQGTAGQQYIGLDNVSVTAVPEPPWYVLAGSGLAVMALVSRRRRPDRSAD